MWFDFLYYLSTYGRICNSDSLTWYFDAASGSSAEFPWRQKIYPQSPSQCENCDEFFHPGTGQAGDRFCSYRCHEEYARWCYITNTWMTI